jgi:hypothetical protein
VLVESLEQRTVLTTVLMKDYLMVMMMVHPLAGVMVGLKVLPLAELMDSLMELTKAVPLADSKDTWSVGR